MSDDIELVTTLQVRRWAAQQGLISKQPGQLPKRIIAAYEDAHPTHLHSRYAHGPGGYDKGCKCDVCKEAKGISPTPCTECASSKRHVTIASDELRRIARAMARGSRNEERLRPALDAARADLERTKQWQRDHEKEHAA